MWESILWLLAGGALLVLGGEILVRGASGIARLCRISPLIIGLTLVAACTSAPEMAVSLTGTLSGSPDVALGNVIGSNIANILLILGLTALICPIRVSSRLIRREIPLMIGISALTLLFSCVLCRGAEGTPDFHLFPRWAESFCFSISCIMRGFCEPSTPITTRKSRIPYRKNTNRTPLGVSSCAFSAAAPCSSSGWECSCSARIGSSAEA